MGIKTVPGTHPRALMLNNFAVKVAEARKVTEAASVKLDDDPAPLAKNRMRLYSYYKPSLEAGQYTIEAEQTVTAPTVQGAAQTGPLFIYNHTSDKPTGQAPRVPQKFNVIAPQFSIDSKLINSYYPPDGHQDEARILPHIVFNDPHLPWERDAGETITSLQDDHNGDNTFRNMVPWMALLVFDPEELKLQPGEAANLKIPKFIAPNASVPDLEAKVPPSCSYPMSIKDYLSLDPSSRINYEAGYRDPTTKALTDDWTNTTSGLAACPDPTTVIFPTKKLFRSIFAKPPDKTTEKTTDKTTDETTDKTTHNIDSFRYMSHVRQVNTVGCPDAGLEAIGIFSIVVSNRTGDFNITQPTTQICHLVSLEHIDSTFSSVADSEDRIGMISLSSWIYTALPPNPVNFVDTITNLVKTHQMLRINDKNLLQLLDSTKNAKFKQSQTAIDATNQVLSRLKLGYTLSRWRAETGEETAALNRGPLVPQAVPWPPVHDWPGSSNTSKEYQILDTKTGLMDLSYSAAWQLGKLLAISDTNFSAALMRFRSLVHETAASNARKDQNNVSSLKATINNFSNSLPKIHSLVAGDTGAPRRVPPTARTKGLVTDLANPGLAGLFGQHLSDIVDFQGSAEKDIYNEYNLAEHNNSDWVTIFTWLSDKLYLSGVPAHYLIPDPSYLPSEALRYFHIDAAWVDCLLDGALSVANHLEPDDDSTRLRIKETFNVYLSKNVVDFTRPDGTHVMIKPQIPTCGFILKSSLVKVMPDLKITVTWKADSVKPDHASVCRYTRLDDTTILCLLDRSLEELSNIELAQPAHQQRFSLGYQLQAQIPAVPPSKVPTPPSLELKLRQLYTNPASPDQEWPVAPAQPTPTQVNGWFNFTSRCFDPVAMATDMNVLLQQTGTTDSYTDPTPSSVVLGLELNDPSYYFHIVPTSLGSDKTPGLDNVPDQQRQLWVGLTPPPKDIVPDPTPTTPAPPPKAPVAPIIPQNIQPPSNSPGGLTTHTTLSQYLAHPKESPIHRDRRFKVIIYADYKGPPPANPKLIDNKIFDPNHYIPTGNTFYYDIVFSIRKDPTWANSDYQLVELSLEIPTDGILTSTAGIASKLESLIENNYTGPGVRMLSNQRFIPYLNFTSDYLQVRLVPRSASTSPFMVLSDSRTTELSFRLAEANVSQINPGKSTFAIRKDMAGVQTVRPCSFAVVNVVEKYKVDETGIYSYVRYPITVVKCARDSKFPEDVNENGR